jgi:hypothetical protein
LNQVVALFSCHLTGGPAIAVCNKYCSKILQETLELSDLLPLMVGQSHDSFTLLSVKDVMLFQHCWQANQVLSMGYRQETL